MLKLPTENSTRRTEPGPPDSARRLFFALLPDEAARAGLRRLQEDLDPAGGRLVPAENLHLTLLFLGHVEAEKIKAVRALMARVTGNRFDLTLDSLGGFRQNGARILWVGPSEPPPEISALHQSLRRQVKGIGLRVKPAAYRPHVTLVRKADLRERLPEKPGLGVRWSARRCALLASEPSPSGSRYQVLEEKELPETAP